MAEDEYGATGEMRVATTRGLVDSSCVLWMRIMFLVSRNEEKGFVFVMT